MYIEKRLCHLENTFSELVDILIRHGSPAMTQEATQLIHRHNEESLTLMDTYIASVFKGGGDQADLKKRLSMTPIQPHIRKELEEPVDPATILKQWLTSNVLLGGHGKWDVTEHITTAPVLETLDPMATVAGIYQGSVEGRGEWCLVTDVPHPHYKTRAIWRVAEKQFYSITFFTHFPQEGGWLRHRVTAAFTEKMLQQSLIRLSLTYGYISQ